ncbi:hypothetical protein WJX74_011000 [Apatococcus lobatus]|uniref:Uncharacterized protein n=1 Tax=Apatococcus lobatus TaxID=904363 RepID=A0AAW1S327_9CHLO
MAPDRRQLRPVAMAESSVRTPITTQAIDGSAVSFHRSKIHQATSKSLFSAAGQPPNMRCPVCGSFVHEAAFHGQDSLTTFIVGEQVLRWNQAVMALEMQDDTTKGRIFLDEALDFRGNFFFGAVGNSCIGCATWHRSFNMLPRWSLTSACLSMVGVFAPWAFSGSLKGLDFWGAFIQGWAQALGLFFGLGSAFIALHAVANAITFMTAYKHDISFPSPHFAPRNAAVKAFVKFMGGQLVSGLQKA